MELVDKSKGAAFFRHNVEKKQYFIDMKWLMYIQRQNAQDLYKFKPDEAPEQSRENRHNLTSLTRKQFGNYTWWESEHQFSQWSATAYVNHTPVQASCSGIVGQHKTDFMYLCAVLLLFMFLRESEKAHEI